MTRLIAITAGLLLGACAPRPLQDTGGTNTTPATGLYALAIAPATGNCSPPTVSGPQPLLQMYVGTWMTGKTQVEMPLDTTQVLPSFVTVDLVDGKFTHTTDVCGATRELRLAVDQSSANSLTITRTDVWSNTSAGTRGQPCIGSVPAADCTSTVELDYTLSEPCIPPCTLTNYPSTPNLRPLPLCVCRDGGQP